ncbi:hypothetical protein DFJ77DRAFT_548748 [Powellomyces hirtus]|nr:hypothetical protein DFJ77DRAFT_548748 [Powellomyces hirtus]
MNLSKPSRTRSLPLDAPTGVALISSRRSDASTPRSASVLTTPDPLLSALRSQSNSSTDLLSSTASSSPGSTTPGSMTPRTRARYDLKRAHLIAELDRHDQSRELQSLDWKLRKEVFATRLKKEDERFEAIRRRRVADSVRDMKARARDLELLQQEVETTRSTRLASPRAAGSTKSSTEYMAVGLPPTGAPSSPAASPFTSARSFTSLRGDNVATTPNRLSLSRGASRDSLFGSSRREKDSDSATAALLAFQSERRAKKLARQQAEDERRRHEAALRGELERRLDEEFDFYGRRDNTRSDDRGDLDVNTSVYVAPLQESKPIPAVERKVYSYEDNTSGDGPHTTPGDVFDLRLITADTVTVSPHWSRSGVKTDVEKVSGQSRECADVPTTPAEAVDGDKRSDTASASITHSSPTPTTTANPKLHEPADSAPVVTQPTLSPALLAALFTLPDPKREADNTNMGPTLPLNPTRTPLTTENTNIPANTPTFDNDHQAATAPLRDVFLPLLHRASASEHRTVPVPHSSDDDAREDQDQDDDKDTDKNIVSLSIHHQVDEDRVTNETTIPDVVNFDEDITPTRTANTVTTSRILVSRPASSHDRESEGSSVIPVDSSTEHGVVDMGDVDERDETGAETFSPAANQAAPPSDADLVAFVPSEKPTPHPVQNTSSPSTHSASETPKSRSNDGTNANAHVDADPIATVTRRSSESISPPPPDSQEDIFSAISSLVDQLRGWGESLGDVSATTTTTATATAATPARGDLHSLLHEASYASHDSTVPALPITAPAETKDKRGIVICSSSHKIESDRPPYAEPELDVVGTLSHHPSSILTAPEPARHTGDEKVNFAPLAPSPISWSVPQREEVLSIPTELPIEGLEDNDGVIVTATATLDPYSQKEAAAPPELVHHQPRSKVQAQSGIQQAHSNANTTSPPPPTPILPQSATADHKETEGEGKGEVDVGLITSPPTHPSTKPEHSQSGATDMAAVEIPYPALPATTEPLTPTLPVDEMDISVLTSGEHEPERKGEEGRIQSVATTPTPPAHTPSPETDTHHLPDVPPTSSGPHADTTVHVTPPINTAGDAAPHPSSPPKDEQGSEHDSTTPGPHLVVASPAGEGDVHTRHVMDDAVGSLADPPANRGADEPHIWGFATPDNHGSKHGAVDTTSANNPPVSPSADPPLPPSPSDATADSGPATNPPQEEGIVPSPIPEIPGDEGGGNTDTTTTFPIPPARLTCVASEHHHESGIVGPAAAHASTLLASTTSLDYESLSSLAMDDGSDYHRAASGDAVLDPAARSMSVSTGSLVENENEKEGEKEKEMEKGERRRTLRIRVSKQRPPSKDHLRNQQQRAGGQARASSSPGTPTATAMSSTRTTTASGLVVDPSWPSSSSSPTTALPETPYSEAEAEIRPPALIPRDAASGSQSGMMIRPTTASTTTTITAAVAAPPPATTPPKRHNSPIPAILLTQVPHPVQGGGLPALSLLASPTVGTPTTTTLFSPIPKQSPVTSSATTLSFPAPPSPLPTTTTTTPPTSTTTTTTTKPLKKPLLFPDNAPTPSLLLIKGRRRIHATRVALAPTSLNHGDAFVAISPRIDSTTHTVDGATITVWVGAACGKIKRSKAREIAGRIQEREWGRKNADLVVLEAGTGTTTTTTRESTHFWQLLGIPDGVEPTHLIRSAADDDAEHEKQIEQRTQLYGVADSASESDPATSLVVVSSSGKTLTHASLHSSTCFVLDTFDAIYVWVGRAARESERALVARFAEKLNSNPNRGTETQISVEREGSERVLFRDRFADWPVEDGAGAVLAVKPVGNVEVKEKGWGVYDRGSDTPKPTHIDIAQMYAGAQQPLPSSDACVIPALSERSHTQLQVWQCQPSDPGNPLRIVPVNEHGVFYSRETYLVLCRFRIAQGRDVALAYFWIGCGAKATDQAAAALLATTLEKQHSARLLRITEGKEPGHFLALFPLGAVVRRGARGGGTLAAAAAEKALFHVHAGNDGTVRCAETVWSSSSFTSAASFIALTPSKMWVWHGAGSFSRVRDASRKVGNHLAQLLASPVSISELSERSPDQPKAFHRLFPELLKTVSLAATAYLRLAKLQAEDTYATRLFRVSHIVNGAPTVEELDPYVVGDLSSAGVFVLDAWFEVFVWMGGDHARRERWRDVRLGLEVAIQYATHAAHHRPATSASPWAITSGCEPAAFRAAFLAWDAYAPTLNTNSNTSTPPDHHDDAGEEAGGGGFLNKLKRLGKKRPQPEPELAATVLEKFSATYPLETLTQRDTLPFGVDPAHVEHHLSLADFLTLFKVPPSTFRDLPGWKQAELKRKAGLF